MSQELFYTSAPRGLQPGSRGFCTVAATRGLSPALVEKLESLSGYRPLFPPHDARAGMNPVAFAHVRISAGGKTYTVVSRIGPAGLDYTERPNKFAHHVVLDPTELPAGGPAWLLRQPGFLEARWDGQVQVLAAGRATPRGDMAPEVCRSWQALTGDAGWGGVLAEAFQADPTRLVYLVFDPGMDLLPLLAESLALLPPEQRWEVTFSTYFTGLPQGAQCLWRCVPRGSPEAKGARQFPGALILDLGQDLGTARGGPLVAKARGQAFVPLVAPGNGADRPDQIGNGDDGRLPVNELHVARQHSPSFAPTPAQEGYGVPPPPPPLLPEMKGKTGTEKKTLLFGIVVGATSASMIALLLSGGYLFFFGNEQLAGFRGSQENQELKATQPKRGVGEVLNKGNAADNRANDLLKQVDRLNDESRHLRNRLRDADQRSWALMGRLVYAQLHDFYKSEQAKYLVKKRSESFKQPPQAPEVYNGPEREIDELRRRAKDRQAFMGLPDNEKKDAVAQWAELDSKLYGWINKLEAARAKFLPEVVLSYLSLPANQSPQNGDKLKSDELMRLGDPKEWKLKLVGLNNSLKYQFDDHRLVIYKERSNDPIAEFWVSGPELRFKWGDSSNKDKDSRSLVRNSILEVSKGNNSTHRFGLNRLERNPELPHKFLFSQESRTQAMVFKRNEDDKLENEPYFAYAVCELGGQIRLLRAFPGQKTLKWDSQVHLRIEAIPERNPPEYKITAQWFGNGKKAAFILHSFVAYEKVGNLNAEVWRVGEKSR
jgi:hypothetical protein